MYKNIAIQSIGGQTFAPANIRADVLRLDLIHPEISGNKSFKLKYHIEKAIARGKKGIVSFGGAYSNHLVALAYTCQKNGLRATAMIRGEEPPVYNASLLQMKAFGMELLFVSRDAYKKKDKLTEAYLSRHEDFYAVPEGGGGEAGIRGAEEIMKEINDSYSHILCAVGTGTTLTGLINGSDERQRLIGISSLKTADEQNNELLEYINAHASRVNYSVLFNYHFGGYAKKNAGLIAFMNGLYEQEEIPTDFVYTGKLFYALYDLVENGYFEPGSKIMVVHSGGLQGNRSLPAGTLIY